MTERQRENSSAIRAGHFLRGCCPRRACQFVRRFPLAKFGLVLIFTLLSAPIVQSQTLAWSKSAYATYAGDASPFCDALPRDAYRLYRRAIDGAGNLFVTGCASNGANNDIVTYKVSGATGAVLWSATYNGSANGDDAGLALATDASGHVVVTGYSRDTVGGVNIRTIKYHGATGTEIWNKSYTEALADGSDQGAAVAIDGIGNVVVTGRSQPSAGNVDMRTIKYDGATGAEIWNVRYDGSMTDNIDAARSIAIDSDTNVIVIGTSTDSSGVANMRTIKYDSANGAEMWVKTHVSSGDGFAEGNSVAIDGAKHIIVTGTCRSGGGGTEICTFKFDGTSGANLWTTSFTEANSNHTGNAVAVDSGNNVVVTGCSGADCGGTFGISNVAMRTIKYNSSGSPLWTRVRNVSGDAHAIAIDSGGDIVVAGYGNPGFRSMSVVKYNAADGTESWSTPYSFSAFSGHDEAIAVATDGSGNVLVVGKSRSGNQPKEIRAIKINGATGIEIWNTPHPVVATGVLPAPLPFSSKAMGLDSNGDVVVTGYHRQSGTTESMRTIKYSGVNGNEVWNVGFKGNATSLGTNRGNALVIDAAGNVIVTGVSSDRVTMVDSKNIRTIKYAAVTGAELWNVSYDGSANGSADEANAVTVDISGNVIVTGVSQDSIGGKNMRTVKYQGVTGALMWTSVYASSYDDAGYSVATDTAGNVFVTGYSKDASPFSVNIRTVKYAAVDGAQLWTASYQGPVSVGGKAFSIALDNAGNPVVAATSSDGSEFENFRTIKYNGGNGNEIWNMRYDGSSGVNDSGAALALDSSGDVIVTGMSKEGAGAASTFTVRTLKYRGNDGGLLWSAGYAGAGGIFASGSAVAIDAAKNPFVTGYSTDPAQGTNIRTIKYQGGSGAELLNIAYNGSADAGDAGHAVVTAIGPDNAIHILGVSVEAGKPDAWIVRKVLDDTALGAPTITSAIPGNLQATIGFLPPASNGGSPIVSFTVTCSGGYMNTSTASPITVTGLTNDVTYNCTVKATNGSGTGPVSAPVAVMPTLNPSLALLSVLSQKLHGAAGIFNLPITYPMSLNGLVTVEPRAIGAGHKLIFQFNNMISNAGSVVVTDINSNTIGTASLLPSGNDVVVTIAGVLDNKRVTVSLTGVNGALDVSASIGFLVGDVSETRSVNAADISSVKARIGQPVSIANFKVDVDASGTIGPTDLTAVKSRAGLTLP